jgi:hypothetical protein
MRGETLAGAVGVAGLFLSALMALRPTPLMPAHRNPFHVPFPPAPRAHLLQPGARGLPVVMALDREVARLGRAPPRLDPVRRAFLEAPNLMQFALDRLPKAAAGDGASEYFIYLALDQCRSYLRNDFDGASANLERLTSVSDLNPEEQIAWQSDLERCRGFAVADWSAIGDALGEEKPGAEVEYASVWFERTAQSGYAPALAEQALRPSPYDAETRAAMLREALTGAGAEVYWLLFAHSGDVAAGEVSVPSLAWLIVACRAGQDCTEDARWYRNFVCTNGEHQCPPGQSALEYYWLLASAYERDQAWTQARRIEAAVRGGQWEKLPIPDLAVLDSHRLWGRIEE